MVNQLQILLQKRISIENGIVSVNFLSCPNCLNEDFINRCSNVGNAGLPISFGYHDILPVLHIGGYTKTTAQILPGLLYRQISGAVEQHPDYHKREQQQHDEQ